MSDSNKGTSEDVEPSRSKPFARWALTIALAVVIFLAGGAAAILGQRLILGGVGGDELRIIAFEDWRVICPPRGDEANCELSSNVVPGQVSMVLNDPTLGSRLRVYVPHGVFLDSGLGFSIGDQPLQVYQFETCLQAGCFALVTIDRDTLEQLRSNENGEVVVVPAAGSPVTVPYSLNGFGEGYEALIQEEARRNSMWGFLAG